MPLKRLISAFESYIDPFVPRAKLQPPGTLVAFVWFYVRQAKLPFVAMLVLGGATAGIEAATFWFVGRLVDMLDTIEPGAGWSGLMALHGGEIIAMFLLIGVVRFVIAFATALVDQQIITPGFYNLVRWQSYGHVARQSLSFFQNDFSGRIVTKV